MPPPEWILPHLHIAPGRLQHYRALQQHHYRGPRIGCIHQVWTAWLVHRNQPPFPRSMPAHPLPHAPLARLIATAVYTYPPPRVHARNRALPGRYPGEATSPDPAQLRTLNHELRQLARIVVHPAFRSLGIATLLLQLSLAQVGVRFVECIARMAGQIPFLHAAGFRQIPTRPGEMPYFLWTSPTTPCPTTICPATPCLGSRPS